MNVLEHESQRPFPVGPSDQGMLSVRDEHPEAENYERFVAFFLGSDIFCVSSNAVLEVVHPLPVSSLPNAPSSILGIAAFRGEVVAVVNITGMLGCAESPPGNKAKLVILRADPKDTQFAIPVDAMYELIAVPREAMEISSGAPNSRSRRVEHEGSVFNMIDMDALFESLEKSIG